jgi:DNA helicase-2/ATP-dependent DNA helicase PcrA
MDADGGAEAEAVSIMTLHSAKGLEFDTVFLPGWEEGLFPHQRALDDQGRAGLEEERRLAHVGLTRARRRAYIFFASNRRTHGLWSSNLPSRFLDELPEANVEVTEAKGGFGNMGGSNYGSSRFDDMTHFGSSYSTPGWQRAQKRTTGPSGFEEYESQDYEDDAARDDPNSGRPRPTVERMTGFARTRRSGPLTIEGELVAKSTGTSSEFSVGDRVFHQKFGNGNVIVVDGNKLTIHFDKAGEKKVVDGFVRKV